MAIQTFKAKVREKLGHYVYVYCDPRDGTPFYVGKGKGNRCFAHMKDASVCAKVERLDELRRLGKRPRIEILRHGLSEGEALLVESSAIELLGLEQLTNRVRGHGSHDASRGTVDELNAALDAREVEIKHAVILITINKLFRPGIELHELYDATRSAWKVGTRREGAEYAFSVFRGVVREVFEIEAWVPGGTTMRIADEHGRARPRPGRWEFVGQVAEEKVRRKYQGRSVSHYYKPGAQNPIMYVNC